jgi:hypothetical protein
MMKILKSFCLSIQKCRLDFELDPRFLLEIDDNEPHQSLLWHIAEWVKYFSIKEFYSLRDPSIFSKESVSAGLLHSTVIKDLTFAALNKAICLSVKI